MVIPEVGLVQVLELEDGVHFRRSENAPQGVRISGTRYVSCIDTLTKPVIQLGGVEGETLDDDDACTVVDQPIETNLMLGRVLQREDSSPTLQVAPGRLDYGADEDSASLVGQVAPAVECGQVKVCTIEIHSLPISGSLPQLISADAQDEVFPSQGFLARLDKAYFIRFMSIRKQRLQISP